MLKKRDGEGQESSLKAFPGAVLNMSVAERVRHRSVVGTDGEIANTSKGNEVGVGPALVRNHLELHGGSVTAASAGIRQGSEFTVRLPKED